MYLYIHTEGTFPHRIRYYCKKWCCDTYLIWIKPENAHVHKAKKGQHLLKKTKKKV